MNEGSYQSLGALNRTVFQALNSTTANAPRCQKLDSVTCFRSRQTLGKAFATIQAAESSIAKASSQQVGPPACLAWLPSPCSLLLHDAPCTQCEWWLAAPSATLSFARVRHALRAPDRPGGQSRAREVMYAMC